MAKKILLYSGGMDSWLINKLWNPDVCLYVDMKSRYSNEELSKINRLNDVDDKLITISMNLGMFERTNAIIPLRNLYLIMLACNITEDEDIFVCLGTTEGDSYRTIDHSDKFLDDAEQLLNYLYQPQSWLKDGKKITIVRDFNRLTKADLLNEYVNQGGDLRTAFNHSLSCYKPNNDNECWSCNACFRKYVAFKLNGFEFDSSVEDKIYKYYVEKVKPIFEANQNFVSPKEDAQIKYIFERSI